MSHNEAFSRILIDKALEASGWDLLNSKQVRFEYHAQGGRADYLLLSPIGTVLGVLEAKREDRDPYDAKEQARGYAQTVGAPFVILSNGREHWFWNLERAGEQDAYRIERLPSPEDLERLRLKNLKPPKLLLTEPLGPSYLSAFTPDISLRGYQLRALEAVVKGHDQQGKRRFLLEMATGTGKTLLCAALIRLFLRTRNAERVLFIVDRIELAKQTMEDFNRVLREYKPVIYKTARRSGELPGSSVVIATIQSLMMDGRYREEFTPFYFDLVINDEAHRSIYGDAREVVQFFQATRVGLTATPKAYLKNVNIAQMAQDDPKTLEARQLRDTYHYFGCEPGQPSYRYDILDAVRDPEGPFLCLPRIFDCRSDITTQALQEGGWTVTVNEQEESYKIRDLERKIFTPDRNRLMCETFLREAQRDPSGAIGKSILFAVNQTHATALTQILNAMRPGIALTITSRVKDSSTLAKDFRDGKRPERVAVSVDMLSTGYNCKDLLNVVLMRPIFSPTEYIQIKGRGTRTHTFTVGTTTYEKSCFYLLDFCAVAEYFEEQYDYSIPLKLPREARKTGEGTGTGGGTTGPDTGGEGEGGTGGGGQPPRPGLPVWKGTDTLVSQEVRMVGPDGEKVDVMTFRGAFERDLQTFAEANPDLRQAVDTEDDDAIETILQERFYYRPSWFYAPDKLMVSYGVPAQTPAFVYNVLGKRPLPSKDQVIADTVDSLAARFNLRYHEQKILNATVELVAEDPEALEDFVDGRYTRLFQRSQFRTLGGLSAVARLADRDPLFDALRQSSLVACSRMTSAPMN